MYYWNRVSEQSTATQSIDFLMRSFPQARNVTILSTVNLRSKKISSHVDTKYPHYNLQNTNSYELNMRITESVYRQIKLCPYISTFILIAS